MKKLLTTLLFVTINTVTLMQGQTFINLDFESATNLPPSGYDVAVTDALPGWMAFAGTSQLSTIPYNSPTTAYEPIIGLYSSNAAPAAVPGGKFAVSLSSNGSISQTGLVPSNAQSLLFDATGLGLVSLSLGGQSLSYVAVSNALNAYGYSYTIYGASIPSSFVGQIETLTFSAGTSGFDEFLDNIQFSPETIPEPSGLWLGFGSGILTYVLRRKRPKQK
jgi:hypothetical protein